MISYLGESFNLMWYEGRFYFIIDWDGIQNIWLMDVGGQGLK